MAQNPITETVEFVKEFMTRGSFFFTITIIALIIITQSFISAYPVPERLMHSREYIARFVGVNCDSNQDNLEKQYYILGSTHFSQERIDKLSKWQQNLLERKDDSID